MTPLQEAVEGLQAFRIDPLPLFLSGTHMAGTDESERLEVFHGDWFRFIAGLAGWRDAATFSIKYVSDGCLTQIYIAGAAHAPADAPRLGYELGVHLQSAGILVDPDKARVMPPQFLAETDLLEMRAVRLRQKLSTDLWSTARTAGLHVAVPPTVKELPSGMHERPPVVFGWGSPDGPFLVPMQAMLSQTVRSSITILLQPTTLRASELEWLTWALQMSRTMADQQLAMPGQNAPWKMVDPSAELAARIYADSLSRLTASPFAATAYCAAADNRLDVARALGSVLRSQIFPSAARGQDKPEQPLPCDATVQDVDPRDARESGQIRGLRFDLSDHDGGLDRLPDLMDSRTAGALFRLPVSVRGGVPGVRVQQFPPDFHPGEHRRTKPPGHLEIGTLHSGGVASIPVNDLPRNTLVSGFIGSGKSDTARYLVHQVWEDYGIPFLVLEFAKTEWRGMTRVASLQEADQPISVYTLGNERCCPIRLNPFQLQPGVSVQSHVAALQSALEASIPLVGPSSSVIYEALVRVYEGEGWAITDECPRSGIVHRSFPTMSAFVDMVDRIIVERRYAPELESNLRAAITGRFRPMLIGGNGRMLDCSESSPSLEMLFTRPVVLELSALSEDGQALMSLFLLMMLREWRTTHPGRPGCLAHLCVVEEAHQVFQEVPSVGGGEGAAKADTRYQAVQMICRMLATLRALGQGIMLISQSPNQLAREAIRLTNLHLTHTLRDSEDRHVIAQAALMTDEQQEFIGKLRTGTCAVWYTGLEKATFAAVPPYRPDPAPSDLLSPERPENPVRSNRGQGFDPQMTDESLRTYMDQTDRALPGRRTRSLLFKGCAACPYKTDMTGTECYHDDLFPAAHGPLITIAGREWFTAHVQKDPTDPTGSETPPPNRTILVQHYSALWEEAVALAARLVRKAGLRLTKETLYCSFVQIWGARLREAGWSEEDAGLVPDDQTMLERYWKSAEAAFQEAAG